MEKNKDCAEAHSEWSATAPSGGLPLVPCPKCDAKMIWAMSGSSKNRGKEYYKCPRNDGIYSRGCDTFMWKDQYLRHLSGMHLVEPERREDSPGKFSKGMEMVSQVDHRVLENLAAIKSSLDQMNMSIRKSSAADEKIKMVVVAFLFLLLGMCITKIGN